ncbi:MAG: transglycosylase SLT domain-containing protein [Gammaproteobacteria bacterium]
MTKQPHSTINALLILLIIISFSVQSVFAASLDHDNYPSFEEASSMIQNETQTKHRNVFHTEHLPSANLWDEISYTFSLPHYENTAEVQKYIHWYMKHKDYFYRVAERSQPYLYYIYQQVRQRHLPTELVFIPMIESAYDPVALSGPGAAGLWQIMPKTGNIYGLKRDWYYDGRLDIVASTNAALTHLSYLAKFFNNNWILAIAAYNSGEGTVKKAINRNNSAGKRTTFWTLNLPHQTRDYVPKLMAIAAIISHPKKYPMKLPSIKNSPYITTVKFKGTINLKKAASLADLPVETLTHLNPGYSHWTTDPNGPKQLVLPLTHAASFKWNYARQSLISNQSATTSVTDVTTLDGIHDDTDAPHIVNYRVRSGDNLWKIANTHHVTIANIRAWNHLPAHKVLQPGEKLVFHINSENPSLT